MQIIKSNERKKNNPRNTTSFHLMLLPAVILTFIFCYLPLFGLVMAFQDFKPFPSFFGSKFVGLDNFIYIFQMPGFISSIKNTVIIAFFKIILSILVPLTLALLINEITKHVRYKKFVQTVIFLPYFFSWAILGGVMQQLFGFDGMINDLLEALGISKILFLLSNTWFRPIVILTDIWKLMGYNMIIFLAAITGLDTSLYEVAKIDGANRFKQLYYVTIPGIRPMIILLTILGLGSILNANFEQVLILYNPVVYSSGDIIDTFVFRLGIYNSQYSLAAAAGLFKSIVSFIFVGIAYWCANKFSDYRVF